MSDVRRLTYVWVLLSAITIGTWWLGHAPTESALSTRAVITIAALTIAAVKVQIIIWHFMEVRTGPIWLRISTAAWLLALLAILLVIYLW
jgi:hypothetical protein